MSDLERHFAPFRANTIGDDLTFRTPYGEQKLVYADWTASGRLYAPIEAALYAKERGLTVITVSSLANAGAAKATHSSGKKLSDVADIAIDNCVAPEDSQVDVGRPEKVAAGSTMAVASMVALVR